MPLLALPGPPEPRERGETLPEEPGECGSPLGAQRHPAVCIRGEAACGSREGGGGRGAGAQISWSVLRRTPGPEEDLTGDEHLS